MENTKQLYGIEVKYLPTTATRPTRLRVWLCGNRPSSGKIYSEPIDGDIETVVMQHLDSFSPHRYSIAGRICLYGGFVFVLEKQDKA